MLNTHAAHAQAQMNKTKTIKEKQLQKPIDYDQSYAVLGNFKNIIL